MENTMLNTSQHTSGTTCQFKFELLRKITNDFSEERIIGSGAYGVVYKGVMDNEQEIAVKKLKYMTQDHVSEQQFQNECTNLMRVKHPNIVRLVGYCYETYHEYIMYEGKYVFGQRNERALCFEHLEGGSLDQYVSDKPCGLDWDKCYTIIKGVCKGLNHLHKYSVFHLDIKPANILLDNSMMPKIGDFGLSRLFSSTKTSITTTPLGTPGYTPPEYVDKKEISPKYDVFSLGVLMMHIMAGRKLYNDHFDTPSKIIELVCGNWEKRLDATMWSYASQEVNTCIEIALRCVKSDRQERPTISNIVDDLDRIDTTNFPFRHEATNLQSGEALVYNQYTNSVSMGVHDNASEFDSMEGIDYKRAVSDEMGGNDRSMHDPMDSIHGSIMRDQASRAIGGHLSRGISEPRDVTQTTEVDIDDNHTMNPHLRTKGNIRSPVTLDTIDNLFQWARSNISSQWSGTQKKVLHEELLHLESGLQYLMDTLPAMYDLIDRAEWRSHNDRVAEYLAKLKDTVYDAEDILDEFRWYILEVKVEGNGGQSPSMDFFNNVIQGSFTKLVNSIRDRLHNISTLLQNMGLHEVARFDKSVRPETSSFPDETRIFGRDIELKEITQILCKPAISSSANPKRQKGNGAADVSTSTSASNQVSSKSSITDLNVLPIVGIGGVGKTTLAQHIYSNAQVKSHFDLIIWVCVSDDFDVKRLTKEVIESCPGKQATTENLSSLQTVLSSIVSSKRFLIVLDDMWDDALKENGMCWKRFCAPLENMLHGSVMLVTTRSQKVADGVGTMDTITLEGLKDDVFWNFFKLCAFESDSLNNNDPDLERIGRSIIPKLRGSPLAAKTLGRILRMNLQAKYWNAVLDSELWELRQKENEILPALRLSYIYLPFHLKRCFSLCAVYPKDYKFQKVALAEIWVAEGFVEPQGKIPVQDTACEYFNELSYRSFFQEVKGGYVIHDLLHDMAQKVSEFDCFIVKRRTDFQNIPPNVRHLSILSHEDIGHSDLLGICRFRKLRTLLCNKPLANKKTPTSLVATWCNEFPRLRVIVFCTTHELPASIGNLKHLRYLKIFRACRFKRLPVEFSGLYNMQILCARNCKFESFPTNLSKLICLQRFESHGLDYRSMCRRFQSEEFSLLLNGYEGVSLPSWSQPENLPSLMSPSLITLVPRVTDLTIDGCKNLSSLEHVIHPDYIPALKKLIIKDCKQLVSVPAERFGDLRCLEELEVHGCPNIYSQSLVAPSLKRLVLGEQNDWSVDHSCGNLADNVDCCSLTYFFLSCNYLTSIQLQKWNLPALEELHISQCRFLTSIIGQSGQVIGGSGGGRAFKSLTSLTIERCNELSTIDDLLAEEYLPDIERIHVKFCTKLGSLPGEKFGIFSSLKELEIRDCHELSWRRGFVLPSSLQILNLYACGDFSAWFPSCLQNLASLTYFFLSCNYLTSIQLQKWNLPALKELHISGCRFLTSIIGQSGQVIRGSTGGGRAFKSLTSLTIEWCHELSTIDDLLAEEYLPDIERIHVKSCSGLESLPGEKFGIFSSLKELEICDCPRLEWRRGFVLPSSLQILHLYDCGDISAWVPSCLQNLASLVTLKIIYCQRITSIPGNLWSTNLTSLENLKITLCADIVSIGGKNAISEIKNVFINGCPKLKEIQQPMVRGSYAAS